ncbi:MAG: 50S ribosomal protein L15 [Crenarchaeota archaeon]|nr:50S ribosomal protein L15 [Thermoproteota archaeon]
MVVRRRKKSRKLRGRTRTMGWGRIGQHRKSGSRGGFGAAGMHKHMWTWVVKYAPNWFGKHGFQRPPSIVLEPLEVNVGFLDEVAEELVERGLASREGDYIVIDLRRLGFNKLLGRGRVTRKLRIIAPYATEKAVRKVEEAGGEVVVLARQESSG